MNGKKQTHYSHSRVRVRKYYTEIEEAARNRMELIVRSLENNMARRKS